MALPGNMEDSAVPNEDITRKVGHALGISKKDAKEVGSGNVLKNKSFHSNLEMSWSKMWLISVTPCFNLVIRLSVLFLSVLDQVKKEVEELYRGLEAQLKQMKSDIEVLIDSHNEWTQEQLLVASNP